MSKPLTPLEMAESIIKTMGMRSWVCDENLNIYMRRGYHCLYKGAISDVCLDIANVEATSPGNGAFTRFLEQVEEKVRQSEACHHVFIESILNVRLAGYLKRRGYASTVNSNTLAPNMFKRFANE